MSESRYPVHAKTVASRLVGGEAVLVVPSRSEVHVLNEGGSAAWALIDGTRTACEVAREIADRYSEAEDRAVRDIEDFLADLESRGAVDFGTEPADSAAPRGEVPAPTRYEPPAVVETQTMEVVAALCSSVRDGGGTCRSLGACQKPFE
jgi:hypothetical protein